jgi:hypothetical protein
MNSSARIGVSGASLHSDRATYIPVDRKILMFVLLTQLMACCIPNPIENLAMHILYVYKHSVLNEV